MTADDRSDAMTTVRRTISRRFRWALVVALACWTAAAANVAFAQGKKDKDNEDAPKKDYTLPYFFTLVGSLAMIVPICMPSSRKWEVEAEEEAGPAA